MEAKKECFVIMPFSKTTKKHSEEYWTNFFDNFITPALDKNGYEARRSMATPNNIIKRILIDTSTARLVLAVLTDKNPNVWYELGVRHSLRLGTIMILQKRQKIPSDLVSYGVIPYEDDKLEEFAKKLGESIENIKQKKNDRPVADYLDNRLAMTMHLAVGTLRETAKPLEDPESVSLRERDTDAYLHHVRRLQALWYEQGQVSIVDAKSGIIRLHKDPDLIGKAAKEYWKDAKKSGESLYPDMNSREEGWELFNNVKSPNRISVLAYKLFKPNNWLIIGEASFNPEELNMF